MSLFYKKPNEEKPKPTDLETILDLQDQNTRMKLLIEQINARLWSGRFIGGSFILNEMRGEENNIHDKLSRLRMIAIEYVKLTEKYSEPIPDAIAKYCEKYREKKPDSPL